MMAAVPLAAGDVPLFPLPLHLVRTIDDPIAGASVRVDEYCTGNRIITVNGSKTAIADYDRQEILEIDRAAATYSIARFDEIASARAALAPPSSRKETWTTTPLGVRGLAGGRSADVFEIVNADAEKIRVELRVDRELAVSRKAFDALVGAAYPNRPTEQQNAVARACARARSVAAETVVADSYGIPLEQAITFENGTEKALTIRNSIVSVTNDLPPPEVLAIPAGAKLIESRAARMQKILKELKDLPTPHP